MNYFILGTMVGDKRDKQYYERVRHTIEQNNDCHAATPFDLVKGCRDWESILFCCVHELSSLVKCSDGTYVPKYDRVLLLGNYIGSQVARDLLKIAKILGIPCRPWKEDI